MSDGPDDATTGLLRGTLTAVSTLEPSMTMRDLIEKLKERPKTVEEHRDDQRRAWKKAIEELFQEIEGWLAPAVGAGVLTTAR